MNSAANSGATDVRRRIDVLRADLAHAEGKATRIQNAIAVRRTTLNRLLAELAMREAATARDDNDE